MEKFKNIALIVLGTSSHINWYLVNILFGTPLYCDNQGVIFDNRWEREIKENKYSNELVCLGVWK